MFGLDIYEKKIKRISSGEMCHFMQYGLDSDHYLDRTDICSVEYQSSCFCAFCCPLLFLNK